MAKTTLCCPVEGESVYGAHPRVYFSLDESNPVVACPYCQKVYDLNKI